MIGPEFLIRNKNQDTEIMNPYQAKQLRDETRAAERGLEIKNYALWNEKNKNESNTRITLLIILVLLCFVAGIGIGLDMGIDHLVNDPDRYNQLYNAAQILGR